MSSIDYTKAYCVTCYNCGHHITASTEHPKKYCADCGACLEKAPELKLWRCQKGYTENGNWVPWGTIRAMYTPASDNWVEFTEDLKKMLGVEK